MTAETNLTSYSSVGLNLSQSNTSVRHGPCRIIGLSTLSVPRFHMWADGGECDSAEQDVSPVRCKQYKIGVIGDTKALSDLLF